MAPDDLFPRDLPGSPEAAAPQGPRQTLAMRLAERNRQRALRAECFERAKRIHGDRRGKVRRSYQRCLNARNLR